MIAALGATLNVKNHEWAAVTAHFSRYNSDKRQPGAPQQTMKNLHPVEICLFVLLLAVEGICWILNELMGHHASQAPTPTPEPVAAPQPRPVHAFVSDKVETLTVKSLRKWARHLGEPIPRNTNKAQLKEIVYQSLLNRALLSPETIGPDLYLPGIA